MDEKNPHVQAIADKIAIAVLGVHKARQMGLDQDIDNFLEATQIDEYLPFSNYSNDSEEGMVRKTDYVMGIKRSLLHDADRDSGVFALSECSISFELGIDDDGVCTFHKGHNHKTPVIVSLKFDTSAKQSTGVVSINSKIGNQMEDHCIGVEDLTKERYLALLLKKRLDKETPSL